MSLIKIGGHVLAKGNRNVRNNRKKNHREIPPLGLPYNYHCADIAGFYLLEKIRKPVVEKPAEKPPTTVHKVPPAKVPEIPR